MLDSKDLFKDITFDGKPGGYREFRRKVILSVASLEYKSQHLAGPKLLARLTGEAWRCTEHLPISQVRTVKGWIRVLECLDRHYQYLPEVELHDAIDDFLFRLSRRQHEGATAFSSRFKSQLARLEVLIAQERAISKEKKAKRDGRGSHRGPSPVPSSLEEGSDSAGGRDGHADETDDTDQDGGKPATASAAAAAAAPADDEPPAEPRPPPEGGTPRTFSQVSGHSGGGSRGAKRQLSTGTQKGDYDKQQLVMQQVLGSIEKSYTKAKPIFPQSVLGHLYMRKYGLSKEQLAPM